MQRIIRPAQSLFYPERSNDCISAIALRFVELLAEHNAKFIDLETISASLLTEATKSGWAQHEVVEAISALVSRRTVSVR